jgi:peptide/nickel transport system permease protein
LGEIRETLERIENVKKYRLPKNNFTYLGLVGVGILIFITFFVPFFSLPKPMEQSIMKRFEGSQPGHPFGLDSYGRDIFSRVLFGIRSSIVISVTGIFFALLLGTSIGILVGYKLGWYDIITTELINILLAFPAVIIGILVMVALGPGSRNVVIAIIIGIVPRFIRLARAATIEIREIEYIEASYASGASDWRIMIRHILPNIIGNSIVSATLWIATAIRIESTLSFLGLGVTPPNPSLGNVVADALPYLLGYPILVIYPCICILFAVLSFNLLGDGIRDYLDPRTPK